MFNSVSANFPPGVFKHGLAVSKAYLADLVEVEHRQTVLGFFNACSGMGFIFGPLIGELSDGYQCCSKWPGWLGLDLNTFP